MSEGFGFVQFSTEEEAAKATEAFKGQDTISCSYSQDGKPLLVDFFEKSEIRNKQEN